MTFCSLVNGNLYNIIVVLDVKLILKFMEAFALTSNQISSFWYIWDLITISSKGRCFSVLSFPFCSKFLQIAICFADIFSPNMYLFVCHDR